MKIFLKRKKRSEIFLYKETYCIYLLVIALVRVSPFFAQIVSILFFIL